MNKYNAGVLAGLLGACALSMACNDAALENIHAECGSIECESLIGKLSERNNIAAGALLQLHREGLLSDTGIADDSVDYWKIVKRAAKLAGCAPDHNGNGQVDDEDLIDAGGRPVVSTFLVSDDLTSPLPEMFDGLDILYDTSSGRHYGHDFNADALYELTREGESFSRGGAVNGSRAAELFASQSLHPVNQQMPRVITTVCAQAENRSDMGRFFITAATYTDDGDINLRDIEMFAWEKPAELGGAGEFRFYALNDFDPGTADFGGPTRVEFEPPRCEGCHLTPSDLPSDHMPMTPIMNEMHNPWTHWSTDPGLASVQYNIPSWFEDSAASPEFWKVQGGQARPFRRPAGDFEEIIEAAHRRVAEDRVARTVVEPTAANGEHLDIGSTRKALGLIRPLFCEEQITFMSEAKGSTEINGRIGLAAFLDPQLRKRIKDAMDDFAEEPYLWLTDDNEEVSTGGQGDAAILQVPARGHADRATEDQIRARTSISAFDILRIRALDYQQPVFSEMRCNLWRAAWNDPEALVLPATASTVADAAAHAVARIMQPFTAGIAPDSLLIVDRFDGSWPNPAEAPSCRETNESACVGSAEDLARRGAEHLSSLSRRDYLRGERQKRICEVIEPVVPADDRILSEARRFDSRPSLPITDIVCAE